MKTSEVRNIKIGEGAPKICVPIAAANREDILEEAAKLLSLPADIAEWRADYYEDFADESCLTETLQGIRGIIGDMPLIFTLRREEEGGRARADKKEYSNILKAAVKSGDADIVDVELSAGTGLISRIAFAAHLRGVKVIASYHNFDSTPKTTELAGIFDEMQKSKADIMKVAVMPKGRDDVITLYGVSTKLAENPDCKPFIAISMGEEGMVSRSGAAKFGSSITFAASDNATAPGQIRADVLKSLMEDSEV